MDANAFMQYLHRVLPPQLLQPIYQHFVDWHRQQAFPPQPVMPPAPVNGPPGFQPPGSPVQPPAPTPGVPPVQAPGGNPQAGPQGGFQPGPFQPPGAGNLRDNRGGAGGMKTNLTPAPMGDQFKMGAAGMGSGSMGLGF